MYFNQKSILAADYLRLSREDGDKLESDSIRNQRSLINDFVKQHKEIQLVEEYIDDGYSGTNFDRPAFQRMLEDVKRKKINCIIVKDLSRLGRNYIETGRYLEKIFPFMGVRFIAITDHYDSAAGSDDADQIIVPFKNLINDAYCRDISIKIRSQLDVKRKNGQFIGNFAAYGYLKDPEDKNHLIVDEYLETGYYLETILPKLNVRFIAITDDYDSSRKEDRENISVPIKNMVNAMYAKDMSKKILAAKEAQKRNGNITLSKVAFGYVRSEDKTRQVVDETVAPVVRMIFQWTLLGVSKREIADRLNLLGIATPGQKEKRKIARVPFEETKWNGGTVRKILENPTYTGDIVTGKLKQSLYKGVKQYHTEPEEWDVQKDMHTPLVARDDYEELQESREEIHKVTKKRQSRYTKDREKYQDSFPGMVRCGECGNVMYFRRYTHNYTTNEKMGKEPKDLFQRKNIGSGNINCKNSC